jgi:hypothetical protein
VERRRWRVRGIGGIGEIGVISVIGVIGGGDGAGIFL